MQSRRKFLTNASAVSAGFLGLSRLCAAPAAAVADPFGPLLEDPKKILNLPKGFTYKVLSKLGDPMTDGYKTPGKPDGMAAFEGPDGEVILIRNHELSLSMADHGPFEDNSSLPQGFKRPNCYDSGGLGEAPMVGGTTTMVFDEEAGELVSDSISLLGTDRNCAGGITPWGTWITCEEPEQKAMTTPRGQKHGYCFEVTPSTEIDFQRPKPLTALGRYRHEAVAVDPETSIVYLTEDLADGLLYRFVPSEPGNLAAGKLQALGIRDQPEAVTAIDFPIGKPTDVDWIDLEDVNSPNNDLRLHGRLKGAAVFARAEGMWWGHDAVYFVCTSGGKIGKGQIWRYLPKTDQIELYLEPNDTDLLENGDNITIAPFGDLFICEDAKKEVNMIRGVTKKGEFYTLAANALNNSEFAGACFSPSGKTMFVNIQNPGLTLAITGPWEG
jgi:secreted PhoX family phosphatase